MSRYQLLLKEKNDVIKVDIANLKGKDGKTGQAAKIVSQTTFKDDTGKGTVIKWNDGSSTKIYDGSVKFEELTQAQKDSLKGADGRDGTNGQDGFSPTISTTQTTTGYRIDITDARNSKSLNIYNGKDGKNGTNGTNGADGVSPTITTADTAEGISLTIKDVTGTKNELVRHGTIDISKWTEQQKKDFLNALDLSNFQEKIEGKGLSTNDFTAAYKAKLDSIPANAKYTDTTYNVATTTTNGLMSSTDKSKLDGIAQNADVSPVKSVNGKTGAVRVTKNDVGLTSVQNYAIASQAEAEAGTVSNRYMTPQRTRQFFENNLVDDLSVDVTGKALSAEGAKLMMEELVGFVAPKNDLEILQSTVGYMRSTLTSNLDNKVDKESGKGLSTNDFTNAYKTKLDSIPSYPKYTDTTYSAGYGLSLSSGKFSIDTSKIMTMEAWNTVIGPGLQQMITEAQPVNKKDSSLLSFWIGTEAEYNAIKTKDPNTLYYIKE